MCSLALLHGIFIIVSTNDNLSLNDIFAGFRTETAKKFVFYRGAPSHEI